MNQPRLFFTRKDMKFPLSEIPVLAYTIGTTWTMEIDLICVEACTDVLVSTDQAGWMWLSDDSGGSWDAIPTTVLGGLQYGPLTADARESLILKVEVPALTDVRDRYLALNVSPGVSV